jgi:phytoene/squalene synthetase
VDAAEAYAECERITWEQARNFAYGIRLLPTPKRHALAAVYAYARRIDDIGDGDLPVADKAAALEEARGQVHALVAATGGVLPAGAVAGPLDGTDPVLVALSDAGRRLAIPLAAFGELIDGCLADVNQARYQTFEDLHRYCRYVAGSIGRLSLGVYGITSPGDGKSRGILRPAVLAGSPGRGVVPPGAQEQMADDLGIALQITNILRDVVEDFRNGRVYLPAEDLATAWWSSRPAAPASGTPPDGGCWPRSTGAAPPAPARWPASTAASWRRSRPTRTSSSKAGSRCRARRRRLSPSAPSAALTGAAAGAAPCAPSRSQPS